MKSRGFPSRNAPPPSLWFSGDADGPWEWKGPIARGKKCAYGKLFQKKAGFVSLEWFPHLVNWRRDGYDFDARYDDGLSSHRDKQVFDTLDTKDAMLSKELKAACGVPKGYDTTLTRLQMQTYITVADFTYMQDRHDKPYGWGVAVYATAEKHFGKGRVTAAYGYDPKESRQKIFDHLRKLLPGAADEQISKFI